MFSSTAPVAAFVRGLLNSSNPEVAIKLIEKSGGFNFSSSSSR
jgi:hypothetical protein